MGTGPHNGPIATGGPAPAAAERVLEDAAWVVLQFTDLLGALKEVLIARERFADVCARGEWFDGSSLDGFARVAEADMYLVPDLGTLAPIPWAPDDEPAARVFCEVQLPSRQPWGGDPRAALRRVCAEAAALGYRYRVAPELEYFLLQPPELAPPDHEGYFDVPDGPTDRVRRAAVRALRAMGSSVQSSHHEVAPGQYELDLAAGDALAVADGIVTAKWALRALARQHGLMASFMPKPFRDLEGSGLHVHQSLIGLGDGANAFADAADDYGLSAVARHFIAGQLAHAPALAAVVAPTVNSYKRLTAGCEAPSHISWAHTQHAALIRAPRASEDPASDARLELRLPDPSCNPYLALAAMLAAGLDGIHRRLLPPAPLEESLYVLTPGELRQRGVERLPGLLAEALEALRGDEVVRRALGQEAWERLLEARSEEWADYRGEVTPWEREHYLEQC